MKKHSFYIALIFTASFIFGCEQNLDLPELESSSVSEPIKNITTTRSFYIENGKVPTVAVDASVNKMYIAFFRKEADVTGVFLAHKDIDGDVWSTPIRVSNPADEASAHGQAPAQVEAGPKGNVYVVWTNSIPVEGRRFPASNLLFARSEDGGQTFTPQKAINSDAGEFPAGHTFHDMTVGPDGTIYVSWLDSRDKYRATAQQYAKPLVRTASLGLHEHSAITHEPGTQVWVASSTDQGDSFSEGTVVAKETCQCCRTSIMVAEDGIIYVAWRHIFPGTERDMALAHSIDGGKTFSKPHRIFADHWSIEGCPHSGPSLVIDASGIFHAAWYTGEESRPGLYYSTSDDGITFSEPTVLVKDVGVSQIQLAGHGRSKVWLTWENKKAKGIQIGYSEDGEPLTTLDSLLPANSTPALASTSSMWVVVSQEKKDIHIVQGSI